MNHPAIKSVTWQPGADDAPRAVRRLGEAGERFDLVFLDPPYAAEELPRALEAVVWMPTRRPLRSPTLRIGSRANSS